MAKAPTATAGIGHNAPPTREVLMKEKYPDLWKRAEAWFRKAKKANTKPLTLADCEALDKLFVEGREVVVDALAFHKTEKDEFLKAGREVDKIFFAIRDSLNPLVSDLRDAAAERRLAITREEQRKADELAEAKRKEAAAIADKAAALENEGKVKVADATFAKADAMDSEAERHEAFAGADVRDASRSVSATTGIKSSVSAKWVCEGINRAELDMETLRNFIPEADLIAAVNKYLGMGNKSLKGAICREKAIGSARR